MYITLPHVNLQMRDFQSCRPCTTLIKLHIFYNALVRCLASESEHNNIHVQELEVYVWKKQCTCMSLSTGVWKKKMWTAAGQNRCKRNCTSMVPSSPPQPCKSGPTL